MPRISSSPVRVVLMIAVLIIGATVGIFYLTVSSNKNAKAEKVAALAVAAQKTPTHPRPTQEVEALVLRYEGVTPCSTKINYRAQIWGDGPDFWVQFPGVKDPVLYSRGKFTAPDGVEIGETFFKAADPSQPVVVRVYERKKEKENR